MTYEEYIASLTLPNPPEGLSVYLHAMWQDGRNNWDKAHDIIQDVNDKTAAWIHAYLHRKEGDVFNANYWYNRAGRRMPGYSLQQEWEEVVKELLP